MRITITENSRGDLMYEGSIKIELQTNEKTKSISFGAGEPEDFCLARDLKGALYIPELLKLAYNAGKAGEDYEQITLNTEED